MSYRLFMIVSLAIVSVSGCAPTSRDQLVKEVLKADPKFASVLDKQRDLISRIDTYERELTLKRSTVERTIAQLRKDLADASANVRTKTDELKKQLDPERERIGLTLSMAGEELRSKQVQRASLGRSIAQLKKALKNPDAAWTAAERSKQESQLQEMVRDAERLDHEVAALREHVRLLKIKLLLIQL
jgi:hypothetical protein